MDEIKKRKSSIFWYVFCGVLVFILIAAMYTYGDLNKIPHRNEGIWAIETLTTEGEVSGLGDRYVYANGRRRLARHNLSIYLSVIDDYTGMRYREERLAYFHKGDVVDIVRDVYYLRVGSMGFRIWTKDSIGSKGVISCTAEGGHVGSLPW